MQSAVITRLGTPLVPVQGRPYWAVKLDTGHFVCELDRRAGRLFDWTLDLIDTGAIWHVRELWLFCPPGRFSPGGNTAWLQITEPGTAFQFKAANMQPFTDARELVYQVIGVITDKESGACKCHVWDAQMQVMVADWQTSIYNFETWEHAVDRAIGRIPGAHQRIKPPGDMSHSVIGLRIE